MTKEEIAAELENLAKSLDQTGIAISWSKNDWTQGRSSAFLESARRIEELLAKVKAAPEETASLPT